MKKSYISIFVAISTVLTSVSVFGANVEVVRDVENESFKITGASEPKNIIRALVLSPGKTYSDVYNAENPFDIVKYQNEIDADGEGKYSFDIELSGESGVYTAFIADGSMTEEVLLEYVNPDNYKGVIDGLNGAEDIENYIEENRKNLGFFLELYDSVDKTRVCNLIKKELPLSYDIEDTVSVFNTAAIITAISEGEIDGIRDYADKILILNDESKFAKWYSHTDEKEIDKYLSGKDFDSVEDFEEVLGEALVLETVKNPNGYKNIQSVMEDFKSEIGLDNLTGKESVYKKLSGKDYDSYSDLKKAYKDYLNDGEKTGGSSGGSSSGGGKGSAGNASIHIPVAETPTPITVEKSYFADMENTKWAEEAVNYLAEKGIVSGRSEGEFCPSEPVKREEFVTMIVNAFEFEKYVDTNEFLDVTKDSWFYDSVMAASQNGIISGVSKNSFGSGALITRQDMSVILYRVMNKKDIKIKEVNEALEFTDQEYIAEYAKDAVRALQMGGIITGMDDGTFAPNNSATRAQAAVMLYRVIKGQ